jgi:hypothetical protein
VTIVRKGLFVAGLCVIIGLAGCSSPEPSVSTPATGTSTTTGAPTPVIVPTVTTTPEAPAVALPAGYPKVVKVNTLPHQVRNWYETKGHTEAIQLAPGVWTPMQPGATMDDSIASGVLDGFCASIKAFERQYRSGQSHAGACW